MELVLRVVFSLVAVLGLMFFLARVASRRMGGSHASFVRLIGRQSLGRTSSVAVVAVGGRTLVLGVTEAGVRLLAELEADEIEWPAPAPSGARADDQLSTATSLPAQGRAVPRHLRGAAPAPGLLPHGSVLSVKTWRQAWQAASARGGSHA
jgi:flagellar protein FliO/FliZ